MAPCTDARGRFQPPKWCQVPTDAEARKQVVCFVSSEGSDAHVIGEEVSLADKPVYTIGRADTGVDIRLRGELASRVHAAICQDADGQKYLVDLKSTHGTFLAGRRLVPNTPTKWPPEVRASLGSGPKCELLTLKAAGAALPLPSMSSSSASTAPLPKSTPDAEENHEPNGKRKADADDLMASLYGDLPEAKVTKTAPREERKWVEQIPAPVDPTRVVFLDIDGVLRSVHGRTDFAKNVRTMVVAGQRVVITGDSTSTNDNLAGIDFWPQAMLALKHIVTKTQAAVVLSSDWRKQEQLVDGINNQMREYGMPKLFGLTPDLDGKGVQGVVKAIHSNVREKRAKEIRRWLKKNGDKIEKWVAIDDMDLTANKRDEANHAASGGSEPMVFLDPHWNFVRCNPAVGLNMEGAKAAISILNGYPISDEEIAAAWAAPPGQGQASPDADGSFQGLGPTTFVG